MELSRTNWLLTSLSPGGGQKMSKHAVRSGDIAGLRVRLSLLKDRVRARTGLDLDVLCCLYQGLIVPRRVDRTNGDAIPMEARIVHLADVYDALTSPRVYKAAWTPAEAADFIREGRGHMFDPDVVNAFESVAKRNGS